MTYPSGLASEIRAALNDRSAAWGFLAKFAADWRAPLSAGDGYDTEALDAAEERLGISLPASLRELYMLLGRRDDLVRNQDALLPPERLWVLEGALVYHVENQGVAHWGILLSDVAAQDPPTVVRRDLADKSAERWEPWTERLSVALVELVMSETVLYEGDGLFDGTELYDGALEGFEPLPTVLPERHGSVWFLGDDVLLHVYDGCFLMAKARTPEALDAVREAVSGDWVNV